jgi:DNA-binding NtrC family response regulator
MSDKLGVVLFVDDTLAVLTAYARVLRREPFELLTAASAAEALEIVAANPVDVVVADERMPGVSGSELLRCLQQEHPDIVRIVMTGEADLPTMTRAIQDGGVYRFLCKPVAPTELSRTIHQALNMRRLANQRARLALPGSLPSPSPERMGA